MEKMQRLNCGLLELKLAGEGPQEMAFSGYGAVFNNLDFYGDMIMPGAFAQHLSEVKAGTSEWPAMLLQHGGYGMSADDMNPIGIWTELSEDGVGLRVSGKLADTPRGKEIYALMKMTPRPAITGLSIGYQVKDYEPRTKPEDPRRKLKRIHTVEISPVTFPANGKARVDSVKSIRNAEWALREVGYSEKEAKTILSKGFGALPFRDGEDEDFSELAAMMRKNITLIGG